MLYIRLFHGRTDPLQNMDDWGTDGPIFGPYEYVHTTYKNYVRLIHSDDNCDELYLSEDMLFYDGIYYGDWTVICNEVFNKSNYVVTTFQQDKAQLLKIENK